MSTGSVVSDVLVGHEPGRPASDPLGRTTTDPPAWWRRPWAAVVGALLVLGAVAVGVVVLGRDRVPATTFVGAGSPLADVPTSAVVLRWDLDLELRDQVAVSGDRVVVADDPFPDVSGDEQVLRAHHVRNRTVLWERRLPAGARFVVVDDDGQAAEAVAATSSDPIVESAGVFGIAAADGRVLWERASAFVVPSTSGDVLLHGAEGGCERLDARSGATTMSRDDGWCTWIDDEQVAVRAGSGWQVSGPGDATTWSAPGVDAPPVVLGDLRIVADADGELVARDSAGRVQWRRSTGARDPVLRAVPGFGVVVGSWAGEEDEVRSWVYDGDGRSREVGQGWQPAEALYLRRGEHTFALTTTRRGDRDRITVRELPGGRVVARTADSFLVSLGSTFTARGLLSTGPDGTALSLLAWPDLAESWTVALPRDAETDDVFPPVVQSSAAGVVVSTRDGDAATLHAYS